MKLSKIIAEDQNQHKRIVLLSCVATKLDHPAPAEELYDSPLFHKSLAYGKSLNPDAMYILSAKHYLLPLDKVIAPYDKTLLDMSSDEVKLWANHVLKLLAERTDLQNDEFIILAGEKYRKNLVPYLKHNIAPLKGLRIGQQLSWYTKKLAKKLEEILKRFINFIK